MSTESLTILGIDPGLQSTGFGVVQVAKGKLSYVASGTVRTLEVARGDLPARLRLIFEGVKEVVGTYKPDMGAMEIVFVNVNPQSTLLLGQARGAAMAALFAGTDHPAVAEYTALQMKKAVVGHGHATKAQIRFMVTRLLNLSREPQNDAGCPGAGHLPRPRPPGLEQDGAGDFAVTPRARADQGWPRVLRGSLAFLDQSASRRLDGAGVHGVEAAEDADLLG